ncbi:phage head-tail connector protein [Blautia hansenii]|uniref:phage head-tail connector protein n=1 Tax=Blautia hansenii TaxID=1322 RepID=UPI0039845BE9
MDKEKILNSLSQREGIPNEEILENILEDCMEDLRELLHVEKLEDEHSSILKEMVFIKVNREGTEGIQSENFNGVSATYLEDLPKSLMRKIRAKRKMPR